MNEHQHDRCGPITVLPDVAVDALRYAQDCAERAAHLPNLLTDAPARALSDIAIVGAGIIGCGIAIAFADRGFPVTLLDRQQSALDSALSLIRENYEKNLRKGNLSAEDCQRRIGLIKATLDYADIHDADLAIEAVFEEIGAKEDVFIQLGRGLKPGAILATSTSTLDVDTIAAFSGRPADVVGLHFVSPAHKMPLLQVVRGLHTADDVINTVVRLGQALDKLVVISRAASGLIGNRLLDQYWRQALFLVDEGCSVERIDAALEAWGMAMGPFRMMDMVGNDLHWAIRRRHYIEQPSMRYSRIADKLCELGRFGCKSGAGWYRYERGDNTAHPDSAVDALIRRHRAETGARQRTVSDGEIVNRLVFALINEGARILDNDHSLSVADIDTVYVAGYGFPRFRGGPMFYADTIGIGTVLDAMERFAAEATGDGEFWKPAPLLAHHAATGGNFHQGI
jgi:3-hydroxyacyl-CoA dehydrogenase